MNVKILREVKPNMSKENVMKESAKKMRNEVLRDKHDTKQILTLLLSFIIERLDNDVEDKDDKRLYS